MPEALPNLRLLTLQEGLELFIEVAEAHPRFLRKQLTEVVQAVLQVQEEVGGLGSWDTG